MTLRGTLRCVHTRRASDQTLTDAGRWRRRARPGGAASDIGLAQTAVHQLGSDSTRSSRRAGERPAHAAASIGEMRLKEIRAATSSRLSLAGMQRATVDAIGQFDAGHRDKVLYLVVGAWNTVFGYGVWAVLQYYLGNHLPYLLILVLAWPPAVLNSYLGYRHFVFRSRGPVPQELPRFILVYAATLGANAVVLPIALSLLPFNIFVVQGLFAIGVIVGSYLSHKHFSFRDRHGAAVPLPSPHLPRPGGPVTREGGWGKDE